MTTTAPATALHYAPNANLADGSFNAAGDPGSIGFNLADVSSQSSADTLPAGDQGLLWIGSDSIAQAESIVAATANDPKVYGYYVADEPADSAFPTIKTIDQYISAHAAGKVSFIVAENEGSYQSPDITATPANTGADLVGLDPYPIQGQFSGGQDLAIIPAYVQSAEAGGWQQSQIVPVYQAFGGGGYSQWTLPTAVQEDQILATWSTLTPNPAFDFAYSWGTQDNDDALTNTPSLQAVFQQLFEGSGGGSPPPPSPTITFSAPSSEPLAASGDTALLGIGVSSTDASDPMTATLSDANDAPIVDGKSHSAGSQITLSGSPAQVDADLDNILASANTGTVVLSATQDGVTQTASISLAAVGAPSMTFSYDVRQNKSAPAPASGSRPVIYDIGSRGTGTLTIADFRKGTDALQFANGVTATSVSSAAGSGLEFNLSDHGHVVITALS